MPATHYPYCVSTYHLVIHDKTFGNSVIHGNSIQINEAGPSRIPPPSPQHDSLHDYEEEVARVLENMGIFDEGRKKSENSKGKNYFPNHFSPADSPVHDETLLLTYNLEE